MLQWLEHGVSIPFHSVPTEPSHQSNKRFNDKEKQFLDKEISDLCRQKCIVKCQDRPFIVSPISTVPKKDGSYRLVTDLRLLNKLCTPTKFLYENINNVVNIVQPKDKLVTLEIKKNGFFHIPVKEEHRQFLGFEYNPSNMPFWCKF